MILKCIKCINSDSLAAKFQNKRYKGKRIHNKNKAGNKAKCTICGNERDA